VPALRGTSCLSTLAQPESATISRRLPSNATCVGSGSVTSPSGSSNRSPSPVSVIARSVPGALPL
jgi:hypothetical protein